MRYSPIGRLARQPGGLKETGKKRHFLKPGGIFSLVSSLPFLNFFPAFAISRLAVEMGARAASRAHADEAAFICRLPDGISVYFVFVGKGFLSIDNICFILYTKYVIKHILKGGECVQKFEIDFYRKEDGSCPVEEFLDGLDIKMRAKLLKTVELLEMYGHQVREPYSKPLDDGIFEIRAKQGNTITRVLYFFFVGRNIILTNGFVKKTQKTPLSEIDKAKEYRNDYLNRKENGQ